METENCIKKVAMKPIHCADRLLCRQKLFAMETESCTYLLPWRLLYRLVAMETKQCELVAMESKGLQTVAMGTESCAE